MPKENIHVVIRFRPTNRREKNEAKQKKIVDKPLSFKNNDNKRIGAIEICDSRSDDPRRFTFDRILGGNTSQEDAFEHVARHVCDDVIDGYNGCIFAYGQTGSGKTYTMFGPEGEQSHPDKMGIIPRSVSYLFGEIEEDMDIMEARVKLSFVEIYREKIRDLLNPSNTKELRIRLQQNGETWISNVTETHVMTLLDVLQLIEVANSYRTKAETSMNHSSSRSHMLMSMTVALRMEDGSIRMGKLHFVDLAGSEKVRKTKAQGIRLKEAQQINLSLTILGQVINALSENRKHVPFRDSKLTHVLKDSLGGNCKTTLIVNCSAHMFNRDETIQSLRFGTRCKLIANDVNVNRIYSNDELMKMVTRLQKANTRLKLEMTGDGKSDEQILTDGDSNKLFAKRSNSGNRGNNQGKLVQENATLKHQNEAMNVRITQLNEKNHYLKSEHIKLEEMRHSIAAQLEESDKTMKSMNRKLKNYKSQQKHFEQTIHRMSDENDKLKYKIENVSGLNGDLKNEMGLIKQDRKSKTSKLTAQLSKFQEIHKDTMDESEELMQEIIALQESAEKSQAMIAVQDSKILKYERELSKNEIEFNKKDDLIRTLKDSEMDLKTELNELKKQIQDNTVRNEEFQTELNAEMSEKYAEIESLKNVLDERTQTLTARNFELTEKLNQREMIQHAYSLRSDHGLSLLQQSGTSNSPIPEAAIKNFNSNNSSNSGARNSGVYAAYTANANTPMAYGQAKIVPHLTSKMSFHHLLVAPGGNNDETSAELLMKSASLNSMADVITAEQSLLASHDYLQKMNTNRIMKRQSTGVENPRIARKSQLQKLDILKANGNNDESDMKVMQNELIEKEKELSAIRKQDMPTNKQKRLDVLLDIATRESDISNLRRKLMNMSSKKNKNGNNEVSKMATMDQFEQSMDAALTFNKNNQDNKNENDGDYTFSV